MSVVVIGLNHRTAPLELLERTTVAPMRWPRRSPTGARGRTSTRPWCCRPATAPRSTPSPSGSTAPTRTSATSSAISRRLAPEDLADHLYSQFDDDAVAHLFEVAAGLDSAVLGESEILGQVRTAWERARTEGAARAGLNLLFRHALEVGKRVRTETAIGRSTASVSYAAVAMADRAARHLGRSPGAGGRRGRHGRGHGRGPPPRRRWARCSWPTAPSGGPSRSPPGSTGGPSGSTSVDEALVDADVLLTSTGAGSVLFERHAIAGLMARRADRPLLDRRHRRSARRRPGRRRHPPASRCSTSTTSATFAERGVNERRGRGGRGRAIVADELERYAEVATARQAAPLVAELHERAEAVRQAELRALRSKLDDLDDRQRAAVDAVTKGLVAKLLHEPTVRLEAARGHARAASATPRPPRPVRSALTVPRRPEQASGDERDRLRLATRGSALARWQAEHVAGVAAGRRTPACTSSWSWCRPRATLRPTRRSAPSAARACSSRRCSRRCSTAGRPGRALRQGPALHHRPPGWCWRPCPNAATPATRSSDRRSTELAPGATVATGSAPPAPQLAVGPSRPRVRRPPRQHRHPARAGAGRGRHRGGRHRPGAARARRPHRPAARRPRRWCPRSARVRSPWSAAPTTAAPGRWSPASSTAPAGRRRRRAGLPGRARRRVRPPRRAPTPRGPATTSCFQSFLAGPGGDVAGSTGAAHSRARPSTAREEARRAVGAAS